MGAPGRGRRASRASTVLKAVGLGVGVAAAAGATAVAAERAALERVRRRPDPDAERELRLDPDEEAMVAGHDGARVHVVARGRGPTLVLAHGLSLGVRAWVKQFADLPDRGYRVVAFDQRGHGHSTPGSDGLTVEALGRDVGRVLDALGVHDGVLVGHSMGGVGAMSYVTSRPAPARSRLRGLVLLSTIGRAPGAALARSEWFRRAAALSPDVTRLLAPPGLGLLVTGVGFGPGAVASHLELTRSMITACPPATSRAGALALVGIDLRRALAGVDLPTLVVGGTADVMTPPGAARELAASIPGARLEMMEGGGHMLMLERAAAFNDMLDGFAREVGLRPGVEREVGAAGVAGGPGGPHEAGR